MVNRTLYVKCQDKWAECKGITQAVVWKKKNLRMDDQEAEGEYSNKNSLSFVQCPDLSHSQTWNTLTDKKGQVPKKNNPMTP